ncbi:hypothetical protein N0B16_10375 [Chryseobacterium sp. GMJ5]|uniref:DUF4132 domain-containing protein n=1 Tax=Chryseobacterium gilvum TaxID=2976534 RepID=A0ABT2VXW3_9FLAO|nr:hypothetical protein [Chryseobacterium gilvum]MCU7614842.1 hypothetical protein [Chryseobacterium gilvum]
MKSILSNPYRITGILSNASAREIQSRKSKVTAYAKVGKEITSEYDFPFFKSLNRTNSIIDQAFSDIEQNQNKVVHSLFWFINLNPIDNTAIQHLIKGNKEKAIEIWGKLTDEKEITSKNFSAFNNIGTLNLLENSKLKIKQGLIAKIKLIESESFKDFVHTVADETVSIDRNKQIEIFIDEFLSQFDNQYSTAEIIEFFSNCNGSTQSYLSKKFTEEPIHKIENRIEQTKNKRSKNKIDSFRFGRELYDNTKNDLTLIKSILGNTNLQYKILADNIAKELLQCSVDYFNESQALKKSNNYLEDSLKISKWAESIAVSEATKSKVREDIKTIEGMKDKELSQAIDVLNSIKSAYEENERNIRQEVIRMKETDIMIRMGHRSINWSAVEDNIKTSINWINVNELLVDILSQANLKKIKDSDKTKLKEEFWTLLDWIKEKSLLNNQILQIIQNYKNISPKIYFEVLSAEIINTDANLKPLTKTFFVEDIRYVGLKLNIRSTGSQKVTIHKKYVNPENKYSNSSTSPKGYTSLNEIIITPESKSIDLGGYGNANKCTYMVGEHKIEIYVEHYKIFTKTFKVDWSPNKKVELKRKIEVLQDQLREVEKFQWFRSSETKQREVKTVQDKIKIANQTLMNK